MNRITINSALSTASYCRRLTRWEAWAQRRPSPLFRAREEGEFLTIEDFINRTRVSRTMVETMKGLGIMGNLPESDQMSLF